MRFQIRRVPLALLLVAAAFTAEAQQPTLPKIGYLSASEGHSALDSAFFDALRNLGHVDGKNVIIEARYSAGHPERFPGFAADLVRRDVDVIAAWSPTAVAAAKKATDTIPIVGITLGSDPVSFGWAASLARPNGNVTGSTSGDWLNAKRLEILKETFPPAERVAILANRTAPSLRGQLAEADRAGRALKIHAEPHAISGPADLEPAFAEMKQRSVNALLVMPDPMLWALRRDIVKLAAEARLPAMYWTSDYTEVGGLISYAESLNVLGARGAIFVDKILKGAKAADLPIEQATTFELVINLKTAKALGLAIPPALLARADEVIE